MFIFKFIVQFIAIWFILIKRIVVVFCQKSWKTLTSKYKFLYYKKLPNEKYQIVFESEAKSLHKCIIVSEAQFLELKQNRI